MVMMYLPVVLFIAGSIVGFTVFINQYRKNKLKSLTLSKAQFIDFSVLALRWYLAYYMIDYGWSKMTEGQFQVHDPAILDLPLKDIDKFHLAWHLFGMNNMINYGAGFFQILGGILIVINRTTLIGALLLLPVLSQIFLIDIAYTTNIFGSSLPVRLAGMIVSDMLILFYYREKIMIAFKIVTADIKTMFNYKWWIFLLLPFIGLLIDFIWAIVLMPLKQFINWLFL